MITATARRGGRAAALVALVAVLLAPAPAAWAHVTIEPSEAIADARVTLAFRVLHGCDGSPTVAVRVQVPDEVLAVTPEAVPGWEVELVRDDPVGPVTEVVWRGGELASEAFGDFGMLVLFDDAPDGHVVYFPTIQECVEGSYAWTETAEDGHHHGGHDHGQPGDQPAPAVVLRTGRAAGNDHGAEHRAGERQRQAAEAGQVPSPGDGAREAQTAHAATGDGGVDTLVAVALAGALLGMMLGGAALWRSRSA